MPRTEQEIRIAIDRFLNFSERAAVDGEHVLSAKLLLAAEALSWVVGDESEFDEVLTVVLSLHRQQATGVGVRPS